MKGWVYIISNKAMPEILKIGYSTKDPKLRAEELNHTGSPHPYVVEYEILIEEPYQIEQRIHKMLSATKEGKEWFRCSVKEATAAISLIAASSFIYYEQYRVALIEERPQAAPQPPQVVGRCPQCPGDVVLKTIGTFQYLKCTKCGSVFSQHDAAAPNPAVKASPIAKPKPIPVQPVGDLCPHCSGKLIAKKIGTLQYLKCETCASVFPKSG
jgi:ssDNA-binding Zn-finger/Zn-ribbon topoisomerase 1